jgi:hypothetical protein
MIDMQAWSLFLGIAAAVAWLASAACSFLLLRVKLDISAPQGYDQNHIGILLGSTDDGKPAFSINGMSPPSKDAYLNYQRQLSFWNGWAASLNGLAAIMACGAAMLAFVIAPVS